MFDIELKHQPAVPDYQYEDGDVYKVSSSRFATYLVKVPPGTQVFIKNDRYATSPGTDIKRILPNIECDGDALVIPLLYLAQVMLKMSPPKEIAQALWAESDAVREAFMHCMTNRYTDGTLSDKDRRAFLAGVKQEIHSEQLDKACNAICNLEYETQSKARAFDRLADQCKLWSDLHCYLEHYLDPILYEEVKRSYPPKLDYKDPEYEAYQIGGRRWEEARDFWRQEMMAKFPGPEKTGVSVDDAF